MQINHMKKKINHQKGFTLLETLVAIFILTLSITGPVYIASVAFHNTIDSRDNISAQYLAEEVVEVLRNRRDARMLDREEDNTQWLTDITESANCFNANNVVINKCVMLRDVAVNDYIFEQCINGVCPNIPFVPASTVVYGESDAIPRSKFTREFYFQKGKYDAAAGEVPNEEIKLVVNIRWQDKGRNKIYTLNENLYAIDYAKYFIQ